MSKGCSNFKLGNARTTLNGGGGSGEPTTREVVHGFRSDFEVSAFLGLGGSAPAQANHAANPVTSASEIAERARNERLPSRIRDGMSNSGRSICKAHRRARCAI